MIICPKCKTKNLNSNKTCDQCGASLEDQIKKVEATKASAFSQLKQQLNTITQKLDNIEANNRNNRETAVNDISMPFGSMIVFMIKWAIASIPAVIIFFILGLVATAIFGGFFAALIR